MKRTILRSTLDLRKKNTLDRHQKLWKIGNDQFVFRVMPLLQGLKKNSKVVFLTKQKLINPMPIQG